MLSSSQALSFANLALACIQREYPNKIAHVLNSDADARPPRQLTPAFYGCFDWHSSVHGHWLLARLLHLYPNAKFEARARDALHKNLTTANLTKEATYLQGEGRASFERPYGLAWLLQLCAELREWDDTDARTFVENMQPLEAVAVERLSRWLPRLSFPVRSGEHSQTAFALGLALDYARIAKNAAFQELLQSRARAFFANDRNAPMHFEPSGEDFLSPALAEGDVMRRIFEPNEFSDWLTVFLPEFHLPAPAVSPDRSDGKLAHLDGLNLSRTWMLEGIASNLPPNDPRLPAIRESARQHTAAGLATVTGEHYEGGHWLGSFAIYLVTHRGIS